MIDLESVRLFILSVELGSLTKAAEAAGTVQPVVSQKLKTLEQRIGRRLIDRTPLHASPTEHQATPDRQEDVLVLRRLERDHP